MTMSAPKWTSVSVMRSGHPRSYTQDDIAFGPGLIRACCFLYCFQCSRCSTAFWFTLRDTQVL